MPDDEPDQQTGEAQQDGDLKKMEALTPERIDPQAGTDERGIEELTEALDAVPPIIDAVRQGLENGSVFRVGSVILSSGGAFYEAVEGADEIPAEVADLNEEERDRIVQKVLDIYHDAT